ncbi:phage tail tube protein [Halorussus halobius]|uniref:phage tail tube protein n=1 Tax=Halorussus halobius TaxID=1710537 RepID=UPI001091CDF1|nr:phage tail tube protein [Halorussus halobius]
MTSAGAATVAYCVENSFGDGPPAEPTWRQPGIDVSVGDLSVEEALERSRQPDDPTPQGSREGNWEGAASVSFTLTDTNWHDLVFADGGTALPNSVMQAPSSTWYLGVDLPDGSTEPRTPTGAIVTEATINYEQGSPVTVDLTLLYGFEPDDVAEPETIAQPSRTDAFEWHGASFDVNGMSQSLMQSASLSLAGLHRFRRGQDRHPFDAVTGAIEPSLSTDATFTERDQLALAVDDAGDTVGKVSGSLSFTNGQGTTIEYTLSGLQPNSYGWADLVNPDTDLHEPIDYHVADVEVA